MREVSRHEVEVLEKRYGVQIGYEPDSSSSGSSKFHHLVISKCPTSMIETIEKHVRERCLRKITHVCKTEVMPGASKIFTQALSDLTHKLFSLSIQLQMRHLTRLQTARACLYATTIANAIQTI